jgi:hypothetical protein
VFSPACAKRKAACGREAPFVRETCLRHDKKKHFTSICAFEAQYFMRAQARASLAAQAANFT